MVWLSKACRMGAWINNDIPGSEDREIEPPLLRPLLRQWHEQGCKGDLVAELNRLFRQFDATYDTHLFAPRFCEELKSEPAPFEMVIKGLHDVPGGYSFYDFNAIDADVLGTIYEQYLGHRVQDPEGKLLPSPVLWERGRG